MANIADRYDALIPTSMDQLINLADRISKSTLIPREYQGKPADCLLAMSMGLEIGLKPIQALQSIAVINNRTCLWGTAARALVMASGQLESLFETDPADVQKTGKARCEIRRKGYAEPFVGEFSLESARKAQLTGKDNYSKYPDQMLTWRAFHMAARKAFPDIYKGLAPAEEVMETTPQSKGNDDAPSITLSLDAPQVIEGDAPTRKDGGSQAPSATTGEATSLHPPQPRRGRPPKNQEPQAPQKAAEVTPLSPAVAAPVSPDPAQPELCGFCHKPGHGFNDCPEQAGDVPLPAGIGRTLSFEEQEEIKKMAKLLRPQSWERFLTAQLDHFDLEFLSDMPADKMKDLIRRMQENA